MRKATISRKTAETDITATLNLDGAGDYNISTKIGFLDHMLAQLARHGLIDITMEAIGDLEVDGHHTTEDVAIVLGEAVAKALGDKRGIARYGFSYAPMDESLTRVAIDLSGRAHLHWDVVFPQPKVGEMDTELFNEFFAAFARSAQATVHVTNLYGTNAHHIAESCFKGFARALRQAVSIDERRADKIPSTKEAL